jgi:hypothetical protein
MPDNYTSMGRKAIDFLLGFGINLGLAAVYYGIVLLAWTGLAALNVTGSTIYSLISAILIFASFIILEIFILRFFFIRRRFIFIGMLASLAVPLLLTGFCSLVLYSI